MTATIAEIGAAIAAGGVVVIPTDTVYGLACDPADAAGVDRIYALKRRPAGLELNLLAASREDLEPLVHFSGLARALAAAFWPGALSLVLPVAARRLAVPRAGGTLMVRVPDHAVLASLLRITGPLASTSANRHGEPAAADSATASREFGVEIDGVLEGGPGAGVASTIIDATSTPPRVLREGLIRADELQPFLGG